MPSKRIIKHYQRIGSSITACGVKPNKAGRAYTSTNTAHYWKDITCKRCKEAGKGLYGA